MAKKDYDESVELLQKSLVFQLSALGVAQDSIAKIVKRDRNWVTDLLQMLPKNTRTKSNKGSSGKRS